MNKYAVVHFQPIELYPPVQNLVRLMAQGQGCGNTILYSTKLSNGRLPELIIPGILIRNFGKSGKMAALFRYVNYVYFWIRCLISLAATRPSKIIYFESNSFLPVYLYKKIFNSSVLIFAHYHEYTSLSEYRSNRLNWFIHQLETKSYCFIKWVSHTNSYRMSLFMKEHPYINRCTAKIVPNFPPKSWITAPAVENKLPIKFVYVGAVSTTTMYLQAFAEWLNNSDGIATLDIYSNNITSEAKCYLQQLGSSYIRVHEGVGYNSLKNILPRYNIGVILYKGHVDNYVYNAPNKLFEYLAFGLDVWFPEEMIGSSPYIMTDQYPKVLSIDFQNLTKIDIEQLTSRSGLTPHQFRYHAEDSLKELLGTLYS